MRILLSVRPAFVHEILTGKKLYEFRKQLFKHTEVKTIVIYASSPICKVVGEFEIGDIIKDTPVKVWEKTKLHSGIFDISRIEKLHMLLKSPILLNIPNHYLLAISMKK